MRARGSVREDGARYVGTRRGIEWWADEDESFEELVEAFEEVTPEDLEEEFRVLLTQGYTPTQAREAML